MPFLTTQMKILMLSTDRALFETDSPVRARLIEQAALVNHIHVIVLTPSGSTFTMQEVTTSLTFYPTSSGSKAAYLPDAYALGKKILEGKHPKDTWLVSAQDPFLVGALGYLLAKKFALPLQLQLHTDPWSKAWRAEGLRNKIEFFIATFLLSRADGIRVVSERVKKSVLLLGVAPEKVAVIPIFVDVEHFMKSKASFDLHKSYPLFPRIILSLGRLTPEKNFHKLIRAFREVHRANGDAMLLIIGSGPERERLLSLARSLDLESAVVLLPWARDVVSYYKSADLYVQPSLYEGWGMAVIEAMASGKAVIMTDVGCAGEVLKDGESGVIVPSTDEQTLASAMLRLLSDDALRASLGQRAQMEAGKLATKSETLALYKQSWEDAAHVEHVTSAPTVDEVKQPKKISKPKHGTDSIRARPRKEK